MSEGCSDRGSRLTKPMRLSDDLAVIVRTFVASRAQLINQLWKYIKEHNLQDPKNKQYFFPDKKMAKVFGSDRIRAFGAFSKLVEAHLSAC